MHDLKEYKNPRFGYFEDDGSISPLHFNDDNKVVRDSSGNPLYGVARLSGLRGRGTVLAFPLTSSNTPIIDKSVVFMAENNINISVDGMNSSLFTRGLYSRIKSGMYQTPDKLLEDKQRNY